MSERLTIDVVSPENVWGNSYGEYQAYMLDVKTEDGRIVGNVSSNRKLKDDGSHFEPKEGEEVWGSLESKGGGKWKLTLDSARMKTEPLGGSRPASRPSESSTGTKSSEVDWGRKNGEIRRQHSQEMALRLLPHPQFSLAPETARQTIVEWADFFDEDAIAAGQKASQGAVSTSGSPHSAPFDAAPEKQSADDTGEWLENLLIQGGASTYGAGTLARYALEKLRPDDLKKCEALLANLDTIGEGTKRLEASYEKAEGEPVPQQDPLDGGEDSIPFHHPEYREFGSERLRWRF